MKWAITYYNQKVMEAIEEWPVLMRAKYIRTIELIELHGPQIGYPITKPLGDGLFEIRVNSKEGIGRAFFCYALKNEIN